MVEKEDKKTIKEEVGLVSLSQETGVGLRMPDGNVVDLSGVDVGLSQVLDYLVKSVSEIKKNIG